MCEVAGLLAGGLLCASTSPEPDRQLPAQLLPVCKAPSSRPFGRPPSVPESCRTVRLVRMRIMRRLTNHWVRSRAARKLLIEFLRPKWRPLPLHDQAQGKGPLAATPQPTRKGAPSQSERFPPPHLLNLRCALGSRRLRLGAAAAGHHCELRCVGYAIRRSFSSRVGESYLASRGAQRRAHQGEAGDQHQPA